MPRISGVNITELIRRELTENVNPRLILEHARQYSDHPLNWTMRDITRISGGTTRTTRTQTQEIVDSISPDIDPQLTYGIELEFIRPSQITHEKIAQKIEQEGVNCEAEEYNHRNNRSRWKVVTDGSVQTSATGFSGHNELVSPILHGLNGLEQLEKVCKVLADLGCKINESCGIHIHHGCKDLYENPEQVAKNAVVFYKKYQAKINAIMPASRKNNYYAKQIPPKEITAIRRGYSLSSVSSNRYRVVNLQSYWRHGTVEFRQHAGSINYKKISNWIKITQKIMIRSKELSEGNINIFSHPFTRFCQELKFSREMTDFYNERVEKLNALQTAA